MAVNTGGSGTYSAKASLGRPAPVNTRPLAGVQAAAVNAVQPAANYKGPAGVAGAAQNAAGAPAAGTYGAYGIPISGSVPPGGTPNVAPTPSAGALTPPATAAPPSIYSDPSFLAYMNAAQGSATAANAAAVLKGTNADVLAQQEMSASEQARPGAVQGALQNASSRGIANSGTRLIGQANADAKINAAEASAQQTRAQTHNAAAAELANAMATNKMGIANAALTAAANQTARYAPTTPADATATSPTGTP